MGRVVDEGSVITAPNSAWYCNDSICLRLLKGLPFFPGWQGFSKLLNQTTVTVTPGP